MFTVIIAEKEHIDRIREYDVFLKPFADLRRVALCRWEPQEDTLRKAVPELEAAVTGEKEWRAVILNTSEGVSRRNPYDLVSYTPPQRDEDDMPSYLEKLRKEKFSAFQQAIQKPLTRLATYLCEQPLIQEGRNAAAQDPEFAEYQAEAQYKQELRTQLLDGESIDFPRPAEVLCISPRLYCQRSDELRSSWNEHVEHQYSSFADWNMYFDKMRYMVFDLPPENYQTYAFDYIRFLAAVMLVAGQETPPGAMRPNRLYCLTCENDSEALTELLQRYDQKLYATDLLLEEKAKTVYREIHPTVSNREVEGNLCAKVTVPVTLREDFNVSDVYVTDVHLGLSGNCPVEEEPLWDRKQKQSDKALRRLFKQPVRSLSRALEYFRGLNRVQNCKYGKLDSTQMEDVREHIRDEELSMLQTSVVGFDQEEFNRYLKRSDKSVRNKINTRMTRARTVGTGAILLALFVASCAPMLFGNFSNVQARGLAFGMVGIGLALLALTALVCLFFLRSTLKEKIDIYNWVASGAVNAVMAQMNDYSRYLSHACNVMRGYSVVETYEEIGTATDPRLLIYRKHQADVRQQREQLRTTFLSFFPKEYEAKPDVEPAYDYEFDRAEDYGYPMPYGTRQRVVDFLRKDNHVTLPVNFIESITLRTEELYE